VTTIVRYEGRGSPRIGVVSGERLWPLPVPSLGAVLQLSAGTGIVPETLTNPIGSTGPPAARSTTTYERTR
jgi:hypothetical protein